MPMRIRMGSSRSADPLGDRSLHPQRCSHGALGVVLVGDRRAEQGDDGVAEDLVDPPAEAGHVVDEALEEPVDERLDLLRIHPLGLAGEPDEIGEQHGDDAPLLPALARPDPGHRSDRSGRHPDRAPRTKDRRTSTGKRTARRPPDPRPRPRIAV